MTPSRRTEYLTLLLAGRTADSLTTLYGLAQPGVYERNPVVAALIAELGPLAGIAVMNLCAVLTVALATEAGVWVTRRQNADERTVRTVRAIGYLPYAAVSFGAAVYNVRLLLAL